MTKEEKQLLLKDLFGRLLYEVKCYAYQYKIDGNDCECAGTLTGIKDGYFYLSDRVSVNGGKTYDERYLEVKPYLRPMSAMTEEEKGEINVIIREFGNKWFEADDSEGQWNATFWEISEISDYLNSHFLDYRGLIPMGLALEAPEGIY